MTQLWLPGAERRGTDSSGGTLVDGPPRSTWHITYDKVVPTRPSFTSVAAYLEKMRFEPTIMWDPLTAKFIQWFPSTRSARALKNASGGVETNRLGSVHIQIEAFFTPGMVVNGVEYPELTDTPMRGLSELLDWLDQLGIPRVWTTPRGSRSVDDWNHKAGHRAHYNVPENDHRDIAGADTRKLLMLDSASTPLDGELTMDKAATDAFGKVQKSLDAITAPRRPDKVDVDAGHLSLADLYTQQETFQQSVNDRLAKLEALLTSRTG